MRRGGRQEAVAREYEAGAREAPFAWLQAGRCGVNIWLPGVMRH